MNEQEFLERLYQDPYDPDANLLTMASEDETLGHLLEQTRAQNQALDDAVNAVAVPPHLLYRLLRVPDSAEARLPPVGSGSFLDWLTANLRPVALAASVVLVAGLTLGLFIGRDSSLAQDTFGQQIIIHLSHEEDELRAISAGSADDVFSLATINGVLGNAGTRLRNDAFQAQTPVRYANPCIIDPIHKSAHLILESGGAAVNVIVIDNTPARRQFQFGNERYSGIVIPMSGGNLMLVTEKDTDLAAFNELFTDLVEWNS